jgi:hypothetical protein
VPPNVSTADEQGWAGCVVTHGWGLKADRVSLAGVLRRLVCAHGGADRRAQSVVLSPQGRWLCVLVLVERQMLWRSPHGQRPNTPCEGSCCVCQAHISQPLCFSWEKHSAHCVLSAQGAIPCPAGAQQQHTRVSIAQAERSHVVAAAGSTGAEDVSVTLSDGWLTLHSCVSEFPVSSQSSQVLPVRCCCPLVLDGMLAEGISQAPAICTPFCMLTQDVLSGVSGLTSVWTS